MYNIYLYIPIYTYILYIHICCAHIISRSLSLSLVFSCLGDCPCLCVSLLPGSVSGSRAGQLCERCPEPSSTLKHPAKD